MEDRKGMIRRGYLGDMVIYDKDLMKIPPEKIMKAIVGFTIFEGKVVYERKDTN